MKCCPEYGGDIDLCECDHCMSLKRESMDYEKFVRRLKLLIIDQAGSKFIQFDHIYKLWPEEFKSTQEKVESLRQEELEIIRRRYNYNDCNDERSSEL